MRTRVARGSLMAVALLAGAAATAQAQSYAIYVVDPHYHDHQVGEQLHWDAYVTIPWASDDPRWSSLVYDHFVLPVGGGAPDVWRRAQSYGSSTLPDGTIVALVNADLSAWSTTGAYVFTRIRWSEAGLPHYWQSETVYVDNPAD